MEIDYELNGIRFRWDSEKSQTSSEKHDVPFELACEAFFDPFLRVFDAGSEAGEPREGLMGLTTSWQILFVVFTETNDVFRIISARRVTRHERQRYEEE